MSQDRADADGVRPVQYTSITVSALGVRAQADGKNGFEAWRILHRRQPLIVWAAVAYVALLVVGVVGLLVIVQ
ncbi:hypothetical protein JK361_33380 [Streptomyces sp. 5-8]|uniref:Uncharacterized protein n=1 Tax=Streptomyces musisoli TaxID=2802280 RepID=A0ABS1PAM0_9ACTN|nr:hypothetical protein [Streptomyces musisoli]MBL1109418.1 hypothetical protein [Streptomyces musisoli]